MLLAVHAVSRRYILIFLLKMNLQKMFPGVPNYQCHTKGRDYFLRIGVCKGEAESLGRTYTERYESLDLSNVEV